MILASLLALASLARADTPFAQDPLCAETQKQLRERLEKARPLHLKYPASFAAVVSEQNQWFGAVTNEMKDICDADAKFALAMVNRQWPELTGQCKPAAEAAAADQEVLDHSEASIKKLTGKPTAYLTKPEKGGPPSLWSIYEKDWKKVNVDALDLWDVPRAAACELRWMYPAAFLKTKPPFVGCTDAPEGEKLSDWDKKDAGLFAQLMTRYKLSLEYNTQRRNNAAATAKASRARYDACIAQNPGTEDVLAKVRGVGAGGGKVVPKGKKPVTGSDITGVEEDREKQKK